MKIGGDPPIWVSHSPTIKYCKQLFFISFKDIKLMYYVGHNPNLLHQTNNNTNKLLNGILSVIHIHVLLNINVPSYSAISVKP